MIADLAAADFAPLVGTAFPTTATVDGTAVVVPLTLVAVEEFPPPAADFRAPLVLRFDGPPAPVLGQGSYAIEHPQRGAMELFLVPHAASPSGAQYSITLA